MQQEVYRAGGDLVSKGELEIYSQPSCFSGWSHKLLLIHNLKRKAVFMNFITLFIGFYNIISSYRPLRIIFVTWLIYSIMLSTVSVICHFLTINTSEK